FTVPSHLIFISLFLGLVAGRQGIELQADPEIKSIRVTLGGQEVALLTQPPWRKEIDLGPEMTPRELVAIGYDAKGEEVGRAAQLLNPPRATAAVQIGRDGDALLLRNTNLKYSPPQKPTVPFDSSKLKVASSLGARLPADTDWSRPHVVQVEMR